MSIFNLSILFIFHLVAPTGCEDQINPETLNRVLGFNLFQPFISDMTDAINEQNVTMKAKEVALQWFDEHFKLPNSTVKCGDKSKEGPMGTVENSRNWLLKFLDFRQAVRIFARKLVNTSIERNIFNASDNENVNDLFWIADSMKANKFEQAEPKFYKDIEDEYSMNQREELEALGQEIKENCTLIAENLKFPVYHVGPKYV